MDGYTLTRQLREILQEPSGSAFLDDQTSYDYLFQAACEFNLRTALVSGTQVITTVANDSTYDLNTDHQRLALQDEEAKYFIKYNDGTTDSMLFLKDYSEAYYENNTTAVSIPDDFSVIYVDPPDSISGSCLSDGSASNGECTLTGTTFANATVGDQVHNVTDGSHGIVISKTSNTQLVTALFGGNSNDWASGDTYVVTPNGRYQLVLNPKPLTSGHTITVPYIKRPNPVYSLYRSYPFRTEHGPLLVKYAAWLYKYRDREPNYGDAFYKYFDAECRKYGSGINRGLQRGELKINFIKPRR